MYKIERKSEEAREKLLDQDNGQNSPRKRCFDLDTPRKLYFFHLIYSQILKVHMLLYTNKHITETLARISLPWKKTFILIRKQG